MLIRLQSGTTTSCNRYTDAVTGVTCKDLLDAYGLTIDQFYKWNTDVKSDCSGLWLGKLISSRLRQRARLTIYRLPLLCRGTRICITHSNNFYLIGCHYKHSFRSSWPHSKRHHEKLQQVPHGKLRRFMHCFRLPSRHHTLPTLRLELSPRLQRRELQHPILGRRILLRWRIEHNHSISPNKQSTNKQGRGNNQHKHQTHSSRTHPIRHHIHLHHLPQSQHRRLLPSLRLSRRHLPRSTLHLEPHPRLLWPKLRHPILGRGILLRWHFLHLSIVRPSILAETHEYKGSSTRTYAKWHHGKLQ
jgi:hypothetical protein